MRAKKHVLVIEPDERASERAWGQALAGPGLSVAWAVGSKALRVLDEGAADVVILELGRGSPALLEVLREVEGRWPGMPVIVVTEDATPALMAEIVALGASDLLLRPFAGEQMAFAVTKALAVAERGASAPPPPQLETGIVFGGSRTMQELKVRLEQVAPSTSTVLVRGESGTGKELFARSLHRLSPRAARPFIKIDCTSLPEALLESELFGYEKGAFTGAAGQKLGRVQLADTGTLFLDEIGELSLPVQAKLLRLLQDRAFERLGGHETLHVDVRIVAATHRDLEGMVEQGQFRQDLFYRLSVVPLWIAPLRARRADVPELARHFCGEVVRTHGGAPVRLGEDALKLLAKQRWPGNARQLQNFVERLVVLCRGPEISAADVLAELERPVRFQTENATAGADAHGDPAGSEPSLALGSAVHGAERQALLRALERAKGNRSRTARLLGVSRRTLYTKLEEHGLL